MAVFFLVFCLQTVRSLQLSDLTGKLTVSNGIGWIKWSQCIYTQSAWQYNAPFTSFQDVLDVVPYAIAFKWEPIDKTKTGSFVETKVCNYAVYNLNRKREMTFNVDFTTGFITGTTNYSRWTVGGLGPIRIQVISSSYGVGVGDTPRSLSTALFNGCCSGGEMCMVADGSCSMACSHGSNINSWMELYLGFDPNLSDICVVDHQGNYVLQSTTTTSADPTTAEPTTPPTPAPTFSPTKAPTRFPTTPPTSAPTFSPSRTPSGAPTSPPTMAPSVSPTYPTESPSAAPTLTPTYSPTSSPTITWRMCKTNIECKYIAQITFTMEWTASDSLDQLLNTLQALGIFLTDITDIMQTELKAFIDVENMWITARKMSLTNADTRNGAVVVGMVATDDRGSIESLIGEIEDTENMANRMEQSLSKQANTKYEDVAFNIDHMDGQIELIKPESLDGDGDGNESMEEDKDPFMGVILENIMWIGIGILVCIMCCIGFIYCQCKKRRQSKPVKREKVRDISNAEDVWKPSKSVFHSAHSTVPDGESTHTIPAKSRVPPPNPFQSGAERQRIVQMTEVDDDIVDI